MIELVFSSLAFNNVEIDVKSMSKRVSESDVRWIREANLLDLATEKTKTMFSLVRIMGLNCTMHFSRRKTWFGEAVPERFDT